MRQTLFEPSRSGSCSKCDLLGLNLSRTVYTVAEEEAFDKRRNSEQIAMKAVVCKGAGGPDVLSYEDIDRPQLKSSEVLIHVHASGVNNADLIQRAGQYEAPEGDRLSYIFPNCLSSYIGHLKGHFGIPLSIGLTKWQL